MERTGQRDRTGKAPVSTARAKAKAYIGEAAVESSLDAMQLHGGWGYIDEFHVERSLRDAKLASIGGGTTEIQELIIARSLLG